MSDVVQNVRLRLVGEDAVSSVMVRATQKIRQGLAGVEEALQGVRDRADASAQQSAAAFTQSKGDLAAAVRRTVDRARDELSKLGKNKDVQLAIEVADEKFDEAKIKLREGVAKATAGIRFRIAVAAELKDEVLDEMRRKIETKLAKGRAAISVPIGVAKEKLGAAMAEVDARLDRFRREHASLRVAIAVSSSVGKVVGEAMSALAPIRRIAAAGVRVVISGAASGLASAAKDAVSSAVSIGKGALAAGTAAASALGVVAVGATAAVGAVVGVVVGLRAAVGQAIEDMGNLADRIGATTEGLGALEYAAKTNGSSADVMDGALQKMTKTLGDAIGGASEAGAAFNALGLSAGDLAKMDADKAFEAIAAQIAALPTPAQRASAAVSVFGKESQSLLPLLTQGAEGIAKARAEAERMGLVLNRVDVAKVQAANSAMDALTNALQGYMTQAYVAITPYITGIAEGLLSLMPTGEQAGKAIASAMEFAASAIGFAADAGNGLIGSWYAIEAAVELAGAGVVKSIDLIGRATVALLNLLPGVELEWTDTFATMTDQLADRSVAAIQKSADAYGRAYRGDAGNAVAQFFDDAKTKAQQAAEDIAKNAAALREGAHAAGDFGESVSAAADRAKKLAESLAGIARDATTAGLTEAQKKIAEIREDGANPIEIAIATKQLDVKDQIEKVLAGVKAGGEDPWAAWEKGLDVLDALRKSGQVTAEQFDSIRQQINQSLDDQQDALAAKIKQSLETPVELAAAQLEQAQELLQAGKIDSKTFDAYAAQLQEKLQGAADKVNVTLASGRDAGMTTGIAEAAKERLALLTPMKSIAGDAKAIRSLLEGAARKKPQASSGDTLAFVLV